MLRGELPVDVTLPEDSRAAVAEAHGCVPRSRPVPRTILSRCKPW